MICGDMSSDTQVLVVGAGPTGLTAASELTRHGVRVRIVEKNTEPSIHSKALVVQPRTLEVLLAMGLADEAIAAAQPVFSLHVNLGGKPSATIEFSDVDGPFSRPMMLRQSQTERLIGAQLERQGVAIEWATSVTEFEADDDGVEVTLSTGERVRVDYLIGCDGAHSIVRKQLGVAFEGSTYENDFLQVDCKVRWDLPYDAGQGFFTDDGAVVCLPLGGGSFRFILIRRERPADAPDEPELAEFQAALDAEVPGEVELYDVEWIIRFRLHERLAEQFRVGRVFLAGDAGHIHTPAGGQGMNTGIQDAFNLAWKLGLVLRGRGGQRLLDSYHAERHPIAADVLRFTDFAFRNALGAGALVRMLRPILMPLVLGSSMIQSKITRKVAQLELNVRNSPIVDDRRLIPTGPHAGDRAPDARFVCAGEEVRMFDVLRGTQHVVFAHRAHTDVITRLRRELATDLARVVIADEGEELDERYHLGTSSAIWVVRPDGHIGFRQSGDDPEPVLAWFAEFLEVGLRKTHSSQ
jgi:2-polyprenyl-6-methoxyphenol hydroxylase-like FAD-dependent oxidoreductase